MGDAIDLALRAGEGGAKYDAASKLALSCKPFLCRIMGVLDEYVGVPCGEVEALIEGEPSVDAVGVLADGGAVPLLKGLDTVSKTVHEGEVRFDVLYRALRPGGDSRLGLVINVEAQRDPSPGYELLLRGQFYAARLLSEQGWRSVVDGRYQDLEKVYSIWICTDPPKDYVNSVVCYEPTERMVMGNPPKARREDYGLTTVVRICLGGPEGEDGEGLLGMLATLFSDRYDAEDKKRLLEKVYGIPMAGVTGERVANMCNLSQGVLNHGLTQGRAEGRAEERAAIAAKFLSMGIAPEKVAEGTRLSVDEVVKLKAGLAK